PPVRREAKIHNRSRAGSRAPHTPPALTFGLPGKQRVKVADTGCFLMRPVRDLRQNLKGFSHPGTRFGLERPLARYVPAPYFLNRRSARAIWSFRKSANSMPWAFRALG